jgi:hypothetical protein
MTNDIEQALADAASALAPPTDEQLATVARLAREQVELENQVANIELHLKNLKERLRAHSTKVLPEALRALGLLDYTLTDGSSVSVKTVISASVPKAKQPEAFAWLRERGLDDIIKHQVAVRFVRGQDEAARQLMYELTARGLAFEDKESIHPQTLGAWVRERLARREELPLDTFGVYVGSLAEVTRPR